MGVTERIGARALIACLAVGLRGSDWVRAARKPVVKHLIEFGWDEPHTGFMLWYGFRQR